MLSKFILREVNFSDETSSIKCQFSKDKIKTLVSNSTIHEDKLT